MNFKLIAYATDFTSFLLQELNTEKIKQIILFGSVANGNQSKESDIDIFIDTLDQKLEQKINQTLENYYKSSKVKNYWNLLNIKNEFHCIVGDLNQWDELKRSIIANGITLYGKYQSDLKTKAYYLFNITPGKNRNKNISIWRELYGYKQKVGKKTYEKKGLVREYEGKKLAKGIFIIPLENAQRIHKFLIQNKFHTQLIPFWQETPQTKL